MVKDLRTFLEDWEKIHPEEVIRIKKEISVKWAVSALQSKLERMGKHPILIFEKALNAKGDETPYPLITNLLASRRRSAASMSMNPNEIAAKYSVKVANRIPPVILSRKEAPVKDVIMKGQEVDLYIFPVVWHHEMDAGPYITAGFVTTYDPETGICNCALQRCWVKEKRKTGLYMMIGTHNRFNVEKFWRSNEDAPVAVWVGHHPAAIFGAQVKLGYPVDHYPSVGGLLGEPPRLVPTEISEKLLVPADAEVVIEGVIPKDYYEAEGPFGEYTRYQGPQRPNPVIQVKCITCRKDAYWHDLLVGHLDATMPGMIPVEASVYETVKKAVPEVLNVRRPPYAFNIYVQVKNERPGIAKDAILAAKAANPRVIKYVFVFDEDVDIFDDAQILWAFATRTQLDVDMVLVTNVTTSELDPSISAAGSLGAIAGFDCTIPPPPETGLHPQFPPTSRIPDEVMLKTRLEDYIPVDDVEKIIKEEVYW